jgi:hypothetical protein
MICKALNKYKRGIEVQARNLSFSALGIEMEQEQWHHTNRDQGLMAPEDTGWFQDT